MRSIPLEKWRQIPNIPRMNFMRPATLSCLLLAGCLQQQAAPVEYRGDYFFGKDGAYDRLGNELPRYSAHNPAPDAEYHAEKFVGTEEERYGVHAEVADVSSADLPPPVQAPATESTVSAYAPAQPPLESVTVIAPVAGEEMQTSALDIPEQTPPAQASDPAPVKFIWPLRGEVLSRYGSMLNGQRNDGLNIKAREGEPVRASADGVAVYADDEIKAFGKMAIIQHSGGYLSAYAHASELVIKKGDQIVKGQLIGFVGKTGNVSEPQLHYSIRKDKTPVDPMSLLASD